jgi:hypothetical protein
MFFSRPFKNREGKAREKIKADAYSTNARVWFF